MSATLQLVLLLGIIIFAAKVGGLLSMRLGQPAVLGELLAGLILGPTVFDLLGAAAFASSHIGETIVELGELGVIFLMFTAGLEVDFAELVKAGRAAMSAGVLGVVVPLILGALVALAFGFPLMNSIFIGLILTATSVSISAQTLLELGFMRSKEGLALLGAAVIDDVIVVLLLSVLLALFGVGHGEVGMIFARMAVFGVGATIIGVWVLPRALRWINRLPISEGEMAFVISVTFGYAWAAEYVGTLAAITGAFIAGVFFARTPLRHSIIQRMRTLTYAFFVPIFLISIGLKANARLLGLDGLLFAGMIILAAIVGKVLGCGLGARLGKFSTREALRVGVGMISRGEVGLIVAAIVLGDGLITQAVYSTMVVMVLATTLVTPILLRWVFLKAEVKHGEPTRARAG